MDSTDSHLRYVAAKHSLEATFREVDELLEETASASLKKEFNEERRIRNMPLLRI